METITISKKEYMKLKGSIPNIKFTTRKTVNFDKSFGMLRGSFGKASSVAYISKLRKSWR